MAQKVSCRSLNCGSESVMLNERIKVLKPEAELLEMVENIADVNKTGIIEK